MSAIEPIRTPEPAILRADAGHTQRDVSIVHVANVILRYRRTIIAFFLIGAIAGVLAARLKPSEYTSTTTFMPRASSGGASSPYAAVAAQLGVGGIASDPTSSPEFYVDLLRSPTILRAAVTKPYTVGSGASARTVSLIDPERGESQAQATETAMRRLVGDLNTRIEQKTSVITLGVTSETPQLSQQIAAHMIELLNSFDRNIRQSQAAAERRMLEERTQEARAALNTAENRLLGFLAGNRNFNNSPQLRFEQERLNREVMNRQQLYLGLAQSLEQAKIDEIRDTPVITVIESATLPIRPNARFTVVKAIVGGLVGLLIGLMIAFVRAAARRNVQPGSAESDELQELWRETVGEMRRPWRIVSRKA